MFYPNHVRFVLWQLLPFCCWQLSRCLVLIFFVILVFSLLLIQHLGNQLSWSYVWTSWRLSCERQMSWTCSDRLSLGKSTWRSSFFLESIWITSTGCQQLRLVTEYIIHSDRSFSQIVEWEVGRFGEKTCEPLMETLVGPSWLLQVAAMLAFDVSYHELQLHV